MRSSYPQITRILQILFLTLTLFSVSFAQSSQSPKRKKLKDFGSSLKRLKWNPKKNAVDSSVQPAAKNSDEDDVIRIDTSLVTCELLVVNPQGKSVAGLTRDDFVIAEDDAPQTVGHFFTGDNVSIPRTIVLIIDYSASQKPYLSNSVTAAKVLVDKLGPRDVMAIVTDDVELLLDFTSDKKKLKKKLDWLLEQTQIGPSFFGGFTVNEPRLGRSQQYSALMATLNEAFEDTDVRPIIILQSDGDEAYRMRNPVVTMTVPDGLEGEALEEAQKRVKLFNQGIAMNPTEYSLEDLYRAVERSRATVYTVIPGLKLLGFTPQQQLERFWTERQYKLFDEINQGTSDQRARAKEKFKNETKNPDFVSMKATVERDAIVQSALFGVAGLSGGWTEFLQKPQEADAIYARIFSDINERYIVGYYPTNKERDGKRRKIYFEVKGHPEYKIYGRRSYFAPTQ